MTGGHLTPFAPGGESQSDGRVPRPTRLFLTILVIVFGAETLVMLGVEALPRLGNRTGALLDSSLLTLLIAPFLWWAVVLPLRGLALGEMRRAETISQHVVLGEGVMLLEKPFTGDKLARAVREALDRPTASVTR